MKLSECTGMLKVLAESYIKLYGKYECVVEGKKVVITKG